MFLPRILTALVVLLAAILLTGGDAPSPQPAAALANPAPVSADDGPQVVAGSGDPAAEVVERVRGLVGEQLAALREAVPVGAVHKFFVFVHANRAELPEAIAANLHEDSPAFALLGQHQIHLVWGEMSRLGSSPRAVVTHELVHELLDQYVSPHGAQLPRWFHEGLAQHLAHDTYLGGREEDLVWRVAANRLLPFGELARGFPGDREGMRIAYAQSYSFVSWLVRELGYERVLRTAKNVDDLTTFERALVGSARRSTYDLQMDWRDYLLHISGAPWRLLLSEWWGMLSIALLPVLVLALRRRLAAGERAAARLRDDELPIGFEQPGMDADASGLPTQPAEQAGEVDHAAAEEEVVRGGHEDRTQGPGW
ncbi:MAG: hypothetical protein KDC48_04930 [Planctomycetes bacterium]|nr:hypothetical protein [Planctomycetota bacterium]